MELSTLPFGRIPALTLGIPAKAGLTLALNSMKFHLILSNYKTNPLLAEYVLHYNYKNFMIK